jgi:hypothetical protein
VRDGHRPDGYLITTDEHADPSEDHIERSEPICGLLRDTEQRVGTVGNSLFLRWSLRALNGQTSWAIMNALTSAWTVVVPRGLGNRRASLFELEHGFDSRGTRAD